MKENNMFVCEVEEEESGLIEILFDKVPDGATFVQGGEFYVKRGEIFHELYNPRNHVGYEWKNGVSQMVYITKRMKYLIDKGFYKNQTCDLDCQDCQH